MSEQENEILRQRYGADRKISRGRKILLATLGVTALTALAGYFAFANFSPVTHKDISFRIQSEARAELVFQVTKPKDQSIICSVEALNVQFLQVGYKEIEIGPQSTDTVELTVGINTTELATTALVDSCSLK